MVMLVDMVYILEEDGESSERLKGWDYELLLVGVLFRSVERFKEVVDLIN